MNKTYKMEEGADDLFILLSFMKLYKMYKRLKAKKIKSIYLKQCAEKKDKNIKISRQENSHKVPSPVLPTTQESRTYNKDITKAGQDLKTIPSTPQKDDEEFYESIIQLVDDKHSDAEEVAQYNETEFLTSSVEDKSATTAVQNTITEEQKPTTLSETMLENNGPYSVEQNCQYEISYEVNGEHIIVETGVDANAKYEFQGDKEANEVRYELCSEGQEYIIESAGEINENVYNEHGEIAYEIDANDHIEEDMGCQDENACQEDIEQDVTRKKRRRRRKRGPNGEFEEELQPKEKKPRIRTCRANPENLNRQQEGFFRRVFVKLKTDNEEQFQLLTRMKRTTFDKLVKIMFKSLNRLKVNIFPEEKLSFTLM